VQRNPPASLHECARTHDLSTMVGPSQKGEPSEAAILHALVASGRVVLMPWGGPASAMTSSSMSETGALRACSARAVCIVTAASISERRVRIVGDLTAIPMWAKSMRLQCTVPSWIRVFVPIEHIQARQVAALASIRPRTAKRSASAGRLPMYWARRHGGHNQPPTAGAEDGIRTRDPNLGSARRDPGVPIHATGVR
jgi:hypothetical protein